MADDHTTVAALREQVARFVAEREWQLYHDPKNLSMALAIEAAELMEHFQWVRSDELSAVVADPARRAEIADEVADVTCFLLAFVNAIGVDLSAAVDQKLRKNKVKYPVEQFRGRYYKPGRERTDT